MPSYSQSVLEQELFKKDDIKAKAPWKLLTVAFITFLTAGVLFLGLRFGYIPFLDSQLKDTDQKLSQLSSSFNEQDVKKIFTFYSQLYNINDILKSRYDSPKILKVLESETIKNIYYTGFNFDIDEKQMTAEGIAPSYEALAQQMELLKTAPEIKNVKLESARAIEERGGGIKFGIRADINI